MSVMRDRCNLIQFVHQSHQIQLRIYSKKLLKMLVNYKLLLDIVSSIAAIKVTQTLSLSPISDRLPTTLQNHEDALVYST